MIPVVMTDRNAEDRRKDKKYLWKEARLSIAHVPGETTLRFGASFQEGVDEAGKNFSDCACRAGFGRGTYLHSPGDGASWIYGQIGKQFGSQGHYLIDFYHVCEYLEAAAQAPSCCGKNEHRTWTARQKEFSEDGCSEKVIESLRPHLEPEEKADRNAPGPPVGSGEIESAHRYVIQERLKIAGAWWTPENARFMLALRVDRADGYWNKYRDSMGKAA